MAISVLPFRCRQKRRTSIPSKARSMARSSSEVRCTSDAPAEAVTQTGVDVEFGVDAKGRKAFQPPFHRPPAGNAIVFPNAGNRSASNHCDRCTGGWLPRAGAGHPRQSPPGRRYSGKPPSVLPPIPIPEGIAVSIYLIFLRVEKVGKMKETARAGSSQVVRIPGR